MTVIVPTYEAAPYLDECMASIAAQDLRRVEVLVVDDASTDDTVEIASSYARRIKHLRVVRNPVRLGAAANVNRCIELARGRWIKPVFQDDLIDPTCLATMRAARRRGVPLVVCARRYRFEEGVPPWQQDACQHLLDESLWQRFGRGYLDGAPIAEVAAEHAGRRVPQLNFIGEPVAMLLHRRTVRLAGNFDTRYVQLWDYELPLRLAIDKGVVLVDEPLATFRVHQGSETSRNLSGTAFRADVLDRLRLHVAYATDEVFQPVRDAAVVVDPPVDLTALARGVGRAASRLLDEVPDAERLDAATQVAELTGRLPAPPEGPGIDPVAANAETALFLEVTTTTPAPEVPTEPTEPTEPTPPTEPTQPAEAADPTEPTLPTLPTLPTEPTAPPEPAERADPVEAGPTPVEPRRSSPLHKLARAAQALRTNEWWGHMLGPIVAFAELQLGWRDVAPGTGIPRVAALVVSAVALAGYGYVVNDMSDIEPDRLAGKPNAMAGFRLPVRLAVVLAFAGLGALPWLWITLETPALVALAGIYLLPLLYSARPVRLKERLVGPLADAANAFVLPALFTIALFAPLGPPAGPAALMLIGAVLWTAGFGLRAILLHQIADADHDRASGTRTVVVVVGPDRAVAVARRLLFPMEMVGLALLAATVATWSWGAVAVGLAWVVVFNGARLSGLIERGLATTTVERGWFLYWYQIWPALLLGLALAVGDPRYLLLVGGVVLLFWPRVRSGVTIFWRESRRELAKRGSAPT